jgi:crossover junction endodeoxyribonuclease RusA
MVISKAGRAYQESVRAAVRGNTFGCINKPCAILMIVSPPDRRKRDIDNLPKAVFDALTKCRIWSDDSLVDAMTITRRKMPVVRGGSLTLFIEVF